MRPLNNKPKEKSPLTQLWDKAKGNNAIESSKEEQVFHLTEKEAKKCRYQITDMTMRMAECTVHTGSFTHGIRMHPPHLWNLDADGVAYIKDIKTGEWVKWMPIPKENIKRFTE